MGGGVIPAAFSFGSSHWLSEASQGGNPQRLPLSGRARMRRGTNHARRFPLVRAVAEGAALFHLAERP
jgi:hypothetical protein